MGGRADTPTTFQECKITFFSNDCSFPSLRKSAILVSCLGAYLFAISRFNKT